MDLTGYNISELGECIQNMADLHLAACNGNKPCAVSMKFLAPELQAVAAVYPLAPDHTQLLLQNIPGSRAASAQLKQQVCSYTSMNAARVMEVVAAATTVPAVCAAHAG